MIKWIGQHIWSFVSRFRNDVYLEKLDTSSETNILVVDSNGKVTKNTGAGDDMTFQLEDDDGTEVTISDGKEVKIIGAGGITTDWTDVDNGTDGDPYDLTITASDFRVAGDSGVTAITLGDTVTIAGGDALTSAMSGDTLTINHDDTSSQASVNNSGTSVIQDVTLDTYGHVTGLATVELDANTNTTYSISCVDGDNSDEEKIRLTAGGSGSGTDDIVLEAGTGLTIARSSDKITYALSDATSSAKGAVELATTAETTTGTSTTLVSTPAGVKAHIESRKIHELTAPTSALAMNSQKITGLDTPTADGDAATKLYADRSAKQLQFTYHNFTADIDTTKTYLGLTDADSEGTTTTAIDLPFTAPLAGKLMRIYLKANKNLTTHTLTWRLETQAAGVTFGTGPSVVGTQSGAGCNTTTMTTYDFTSSLDSGDNIIDAGDSVYLSIQDDTATANTKWYVTCLWQWDLSSIGA